MCPWFWETRLVLRWGQSRLNLVACWCYGLAPESEGLANVDAPKRVGLACRPSFLFGDACGASSGQVHLRVDQQGRVNGPEVRGLGVHARPVGSRKTPQAQALGPSRALFRSLSLLVRLLRCFCSSQIRLGLLISHATSMTIGHCACALMGLTRSGVVRRLRSSVLGGGHLHMHACAHLHGQMTAAGRGISRASSWLRRRVRHG